MTFAITDPTQLVGPQLLGSGATAPSPPGSPIYVGMAMRFSVEIGGLSLGHWQSCSGLRVDFKTTPVDQGGEYRRRTLLPDTVEYGDVTLKRAVHRDGSQAVAAWLQTAVQSWVNWDGTGVRYQGGGQTATVKVLDARGDPAYAWRLHGVYPKSWSGPELDASGGSRVATETLVFSFDGFDGWV